MVKRLRELRTAAGLSQQQLADVIGVSQQAINKYENHNVEPDIAMLIRLADYFLVTVDYLIGRTNRSENIESAALSPEESQVIKDYRNLDSDEKESIRLVIKNYRKRSGKK